ncbi:MAG: phage holin family protein [Clostridia bacterium]|nr:phage holin family protein [Clostridia bacterium]
MKQFWGLVQTVLTAAGGFIGWFLGGADGFLYTLVAFVCLDYVTGVLCAIADHRLSSAVGFRGICRKALIFALVGIGHMTDLFLIGTGAAVRTAVICFYLSNEGISLLENAARLGLPIPDKLRAILEQLSDKE